MGSSMSKAQIVAHFADKYGWKKVEVARFFEDFATLAYKEAANQFTIPGIGKLVMKDRKERQGRNPKTGESITISARRVLKFRVAKAAKDAVLKNNLF